MNLFLQIFLLLIFPVLLLIFRLIPLNLRGAVLVVVVLATVYLIFKEKMKAKSLGFRTDNFKQSLLPYTAFTLLSLVVLASLVVILGKKPLDNWWTYSHLQWAFLPISFVQEFVYRAYFQTKLQKVLQPSLAILITATLYSAMHVLWKDPLIIALTFGSGLGWGYLWYKYPNLYLISLSHTVLNYLIILFGFFPWLITEYF